VRLLAIFWERLDVFFLTRVGRLKRLAATREPKAAAQTPPEEQLASIAVEGNRMVRRAYELCSQLLSIHNLRFLMNQTRIMRQAAAAGTFKQAKKAFMDAYLPAK